MKTIDSTTAKKKLAELRRINPKSYATNYFLNPLAEELLCFENENAIIFLNPDRHIHRLIFAYLDLSDLEKLLCELPDDLQISLEIVTKQDLDDGLRAALERHLVYDTTFIRSTCKLEKIRKFNMKYGDEIRFAEPCDIPAVERLLSETFSYHSSHYPDEKELADLVQNKQVIVLKRDKILGVVIYKKINQIVNFDQLVNRDENQKSLLGLLDFFYTELRKQNLEECFLWVDIDNNMTVQKMQEFYGYKPDGLKNIIFVNNLLKSKLIN